MISFPAIILSSKMLSVAGTGEAMDRNEKYHALKRSVFFRDIPDSDLLALAESMSVIIFHEKETVCAAGDEADQIFLVVSGQLKVSVPGSTKEGRSLSSGDVFGEYGLFVEDVRSADVKSIGETVLLALDYERFQAFLELFPATTYALLKEAVQRLVTLEKLTLLSGQR